MGWGLISVLFGSTGQILIKQGVKESVITSLTSWPLWVGLILYGLAFLTWIKFLINTPLSKAYPLLSLNFVLIAIMSIIILKEPFDFKILIGTLFCIGGVLIINQ